MVMASGWQSFDCQFEPYLRAFMRRPCGVAWDAVPEPMVEYIDPDFTLNTFIHQRTALFSQGMQHHCQLNFRSLICLCTLQSHPQPMAFFWGLATVVQIVAEASSILGKY
jgi:hypothetical protein